MDFFQFHLLHILSALDYRLLNLSTNHHGESCLANRKNRSHFLSHIWTSLTFLSGCCWTIRIICFLHSVFCRNSDNHFSHRGEGYVRCQNNSCTRHSSSRAEEAGDWNSFWGGGEDRFPCLHSKWLTGSHSEFCRGCSHTQDRAK